MIDYRINLKRELKLRGIVHARAAEVLGIKRSWFTQIINGRVKRKLKVEEVILLCKTFNISQKKVLG